VWFSNPNMPFTTDDTRDQAFLRFACGFIDDVKDIGQMLPPVSSNFQPVSASATPFMNVIRPTVSVAMTASPMLDSVTWSRSRCSSAHCTVAHYRWLTRPGGPFLRQRQLIAV